MKLNSNILIIFTFLYISLEGGDILNCRITCYALGGIMDVKISPNFDETKLDSGSIEDLIDVFEDRVRYWLLEPTKSLLKTQHGDIAALCLILTYFEIIQM